MRGIAILKLEESLWEDIKNGNKDIEIRKLNKDYIQKGYYIQYCGLNTNELLGTVLVTNKLYLKKEYINVLTKHKATNDFVEKYYTNEKLLIGFVVDYLEGILDE